MADATKRTNYFSRQFLRAPDFQDDQAYHIDRRRRHNMGLHSSGVVTGLQVVASGTANEVNLEAGWAIDPLGREIVLAAPRNNIPTGGVAIEIWISYPDPEPLTDASTDPGVTGFTRVNEDPVVTVVPPGTVPANGIRLATVSAAGAINNNIRPLAGLIDNTVTSAKIAEADSTTAQNTNLGSGVKEGHIQNNAVAAGKLRSDANNANDAQRAVTTNHIRNLNITEPKLADNAVSTRTIVDNAVTAAKILDGTVGTAELSGTAVTEPKLANNAVSTRTIADNAVTAAKIQDGSVGTAELADNTVTNLKIATEAITQPKVAPGTVSIRQMKASVVAEGTTALGASAVVFLPPVVFLGGNAEPAGFYLANISINDPVAPGVNLRIAWQEEYVVFQSQPPFNITTVGRQWRVTNLTATALTVAFKIYKLEES